MAEVDLEFRELIKQQSGTSISIDEYSESSQQIKKRKGKGLADPFANEFDPRYAETSRSTQQKLRNKLVDEIQVQTANLQDEPGGTRGQHAARFANRVPSLDDSVNLVGIRLIERSHVREIKRSQGTDSSSISIYKYPLKPEFGGTPEQQPQIVSIGPYHLGKDNLLEFEEHKWTFLEKFLRRARTSSSTLLGYHMERMMEMEELARNCYQHKSDMSSHDFVEMMLLDGCFIIVLLHLLGGDGYLDASDVDDNFVFAMPWIIPVLNQDLLKMENQLFPFFVLDYLFSYYKNNDERKSLPSLALNVFGLSFPMPLKTRWNLARDPLHLLDLVYVSLLPPVHAFNGDESYHPSKQSIQSVARLRPSGIKFKPTCKTTSFLEIKYKRQVLEIPTITINDYTTCLLTNCIAWEHSHRHNFTTFSYFTDYITFMNFLISEPRDVAFLCADGIISRLSLDDASVASWFNYWRMAIVFNNRGNYLSNELGKMEAYYSSNWATLSRTYFSSPWSFLLVFTAFLLIVCSLIQTIISIVSYNNARSRE